MLTLLGLFVGFMGLFGFIACIGGLIYALVAKKGKIGWLIGLLLCVVLVPAGLIIVGTSLSNDTPPAQKTEDTKQDNNDETDVDENDNKPEPPQEDKSDEPESEDEGDDGTIKSGSYTLPCGMEIYFFDSVRNDVTGKWRRAMTSDSFVPADYAFEYYTEMFSSDDEIHSIWNATLGTNTRIMVSAGILFVDTLEYVEGEEHDAKLMFSGDVLDSKMIDAKTGEPVEFDS